MRSYLLLGALAGRALSQAAEWGQCGGQGWTGATSCVSPYVCCYENAYYYQCLSSCSSTAPAATSTSTSTKTSSTSSTTTTTSSTGAFKWFGVDESGAEFGSGVYPGVWGTNFIFPSETSLATLMSQGFNIFRLPFSMERMIPNELTGTLATAYLQNYTQIVNYITSNGGWAVIDPHNYGRYYGNIITDVTGFQTFWETLAAQFASNQRAIFDTNNEYHDEDQTLVLNLNQAAINGIRAAGATSQYIFVEGNSYSGAWTWNTTNTNLAALADPQNKIIYEMHQYLDSDSSGTSETCVSSTIGAERLKAATQWLKANKKKGILGETAGGANAQCIAALKGELQHLLDNSDVWTGWLYWAAGPWWGDYMFSMEPTTGTAYKKVLPQIKQFIGA